MKITREEILHLAKLSDFDLEESEIDGLSKNLEDIIGYISSMSGGYDANDDTGEQGFAKVEEAVK